MKLIELDQMFFSSNGMYMEELLFLVAYLVDKLAPEELTVKLIDFSFYPPPRSDESTCNIDLQVGESSMVLTIILMLVPMDNSNQFTFALAITMVRKVINLNYYIYII